MEAKKDFEIGDLVWAKMKYYPYWPAQIVKPPTGAKSTTPKNAHSYVYFFGSKNYAWISHDNIVHDTIKMSEFAFDKKKPSASLKCAVEEMNEERSKAPKRAKSTLKVRETRAEGSTSSIKRETRAEGSTSSIKREISAEGSTSRIQKEMIKIKKHQVIKETPNVQKKTTSKRRFHDESANKRTTSPPKLSKRYQDYSELILNTPPNIGYKRAAVIRPSAQADHTNALCSFGITGRNYFGLLPYPTLDLRKPNEAVRARNIRAIPKKIGFIGLGMMGQRLVKKLITFGHKVMVWNRTLEKCLNFVKIGALLAQNPADLVVNCDFIFCCVSGPDASKSLVFGNCGILSGLDNCTAGVKGYIEMTTIDPTTSQEIAEAITQKGGRYLEAPISGSREMAEEGALLILGAGDRELFTQCESCFFALSKHAYYLSCDVGSGSKMNLILSMLLGVSYAALAEALALVERCSLSNATFLEILENRHLKSNLLTEKGRAMTYCDFETNFSLKNQQKDLSLALSLGDGVNQPLSLTETANKLYNNDKLIQYSHHDVSAVFLGAKQ